MWHAVNRRPPRLNCSVNTLASAPALPPSQAKQDQVLRQGRHPVPDNQLWAEQYGMTALETAGGGACLPGLCSAQSHSHSMPGVCNGLSSSAWQAAKPSSPATSTKAPAAAAQRGAHMPILGPAAWFLGSSAAWAPAGVTWSLSPSVPACMMCQRSTEQFVLGSPGTWRAASAPHVLLCTSECAIVTNVLLMYC